MAIDNDIAAALPEPPPPRPARRDVAIEAALRRFDGGVADPPRASPPASWRGRIVRPQFAAFATIALVALIGLPVWMSGDHRFSSVSPEAPASPVPGPVPSPAPGTANRPVASGSVTTQAQVPPPLKSIPTVPLVVSPRVEPVLANPPSAVVADRRDGGCAGGNCATPIDAPTNGWRVEDRDKATVAGLSAPEPPPAEEKRLGKDFYARAENRAELGYAAPPPPPAAAPPAAAPSAVPSPPPRAPAIAGLVVADASPGADITVTGTRAKESSYEDLVVTGQRRSAAKPAPYGDWNACTVNDPKQRLDACRKIVNPAAAGPKGRAAAHVADGLSRAWQNDLDSAIAAFDQAIAISPRLSFAYLNRGLVYARKGELDRALEDLNRAVRYAPDVARNYYSRSLLWRQRGDSKRAEADQARAITLDQ